MLPVHICYMYSIHLIFNLLVRLWNPVYNAGCIWIFSRQSVSRVQNIKTFVVLFKMYTLWKLNPRPRLTSDDIMGFPMLMSIAITCLDFYFAVIPCNAYQHIGCWGPTGYCSRATYHSELDASARWVEALRR